MDKDSRKDFLLIVFVAYLVGESIGYIIGTSIEIKSINVLFATGMGLFFSIIIVPFILKCKD